MRYMPFRSERLLMCFGLKKKASCGGNRVKYINNKGEMKSSERPETISQRSKL